jgi:predicted PhzF superfamily epimerase YddE/YHI9
MSSSGIERFVSRMFAPGLIPGGEDHVCGSAHCVITPYWYDKLGISRGLEIRARQVSPRGGELGLLWEADQNVLRVKGAATFLAKGELQIPIS